MIFFFFSFFLLLSSSIDHVFHILYVYGCNDQMNSIRKQIECNQDMILNLNSSTKKERKDGVCIVGGILIMRGFLLCTIVIVLLTVVVAYTDSIEEHNFGLWLAASRGDVDAVQHALHGNRLIRATKDHYKYEVIDRHHYEGK